MCETKPEQSDLYQTILAHTAVILGQLNKKVAWLFAQ